MASDKTSLLNELRIDRSETDADGGSRRWLIWLIGAAILIGAVAITWWIAGRDKAEPAAPAAAQSAATQTQSAAPAPTAILQATGYVTARRQATVSAQITGTLTEVLIEEGERVEANQILARLEDTAQQARLAEAQAQLNQAKAQAIQIKTRLGQAQRDYQRQQDLADRKLVALQAVEGARTEVESLTAQWTAQQGTVEVARAQLRSAQVQLDYTTVRAPFAGVITAKAAQVGEIVSPLSAGGGFTRTGIGTVVDMDSLEIEVDVNEAYINRVTPGGRAQAVLDAYPDWTIPAHVIAIIPTADRSKATVKVRVGLEQKDPRILPDMGVRVSFLPPENDNAAKGKQQP